jgi:hypothetical protein
MKHMRKLGALLMVIVAVLALGPAPAAGAASAQIHVFPPQARPYGHTYSEWEVRFGQWFLAIPAAENPLLDASGAHCAVGQSGPVWFFIGFIHSGTLVRTCTLPAGKALLLNLSGGECSTAEGNGKTFEALRKCARNYNPPTTEVDATVDEAHLTNLTRYRFATPLYRFAYPAGNILGVHGSGTSQSVEDGIFVMLAPLAAGRHTVVTHIVDPSSHWDVRITYRLTISS